MLASVDRNLKKYVEKDGGMVAISIAKAEDGSWRVSFYKLEISSSSSNSGCIVTRTVKSIPEINEKIEILSRFTSDIITYEIQNELNSGKKKCTSDQVRLQVVRLLASYASLWILPKTCSLTTSPSPYFAKHRRKNQQSAKKKGKTI